MRCDDDYLASKEQIFILFVKFLKKRGLFHNLYKRETGKKTRSGFPPMRIYCQFKRCYASDLWMNYSACFLKEAETNEYNPNSRKLQLSQLWRFFLLDNLETLVFKDDEAKEGFAYSLIDIIQTNGIRNSDEVSDYFKKYNIGNIRGKEKLKKLIKR